MGRRFIRKIRVLGIIVSLSIGSICSAQVSSSEWRYYGVNEADIARKRQQIGSALERAIEKALRELQLKQQAQANAEHAYDATMAAGVSAIAATNSMNDNLNYIQVEDYMDRTYVSEDNRPYIKDPVNLRERYRDASRSSVDAESIWGDNTSPGIAHILANYDIETIQRDLIPDLRQRLLEDYEALKKAIPGSERAIALEKDIWVCEEDLKDFEDAIKAADRGSSWGQNMPPLEFSHDKGTVVYSREIAEDVLDPMSEKDFLSYCQSANDDIKKMYTGYSDYYMAESCEIVDGKLITRIYFTNLQPTELNTISTTHDMGSPSLYSEAEKAQYLDGLDKELSAKKLELAKKLRTIDAYEQYQASLDKDITSNNVYILDNLAQVVKKEIHLDLSKDVPKYAPMGAGEIKEQAEKAVNDKIDSFIDAGVQGYYEDFDVQPNPYETKKLATVDTAVQGYNDTNKAYKYAKKFAKAAGIFDKDIPKQFEKDMKALDKALGHVPSKVTGAVGKYMFFIKNRYELGSSLGLGAANIAIYSMKNENRQFLEQKNKEAQQLREEIQRMEERRNSIAH